MTTVLRGSDNFDTYKSFTSSPLTITNNSIHSAEHGLGAVPNKISGYLVCVIANGSFEVGDIMPVPASRSAAGTSTSTYNFDMRANATTVYAALNNNGIVCVFDGLLTNSNFSLVLKAEL